MMSFPRKGNHLVDTKLFILSANILHISNEDIDDAKNPKSMKGKKKVLGTCNIRATLL